MESEETTGRDLRCLKLLSAGPSTVEHFRGTVLTYSRLILIGIGSFYRAYRSPSRVQGAAEAESFPLKMYTWRDVSASRHRRRHSNTDQRVSCWGASAIGGIASRCVETEVRIARRGHTYLSTVINRALENICSPKGGGVPRYSSTSCKGCAKGRSALSNARKRTSPVGLPRLISCGSR